MNISKMNMATEKMMKLHAGQVRKGDGTPYFYHPLRVAFLTALYVAQEELVIAALLHDTIEDTPYTEKELREDFGDVVANLVMLLTEDKNISGWIKRKAEAVEKVKPYPAAAVIKACDAYANMESLFEAVEKQGEGVWDKFNAPKGLKLIYFRGILEAAREHLPAVFVQSYAELLKDLEYASQATEAAPILGFTTAEVR